MSMRGDDQRQTAMFSYLTLAQRIAADHPARQIRVLVEPGAVADGWRVGEVVRGQGAVRRSLRNVCCEPRC